MKTTRSLTVAVAELKARLSHYLRAVKAGREVTITDRGRVVARLVPVTGVDAGRARVQELLETGAARASAKRLPPDFWTAPRPTDEDARALAMLLDDRREGR